MLAKVNYLLDPPLFCLPIIWKSNCGHETLLTWSCKSQDQTTLGSSMEFLPLSRTGSTAMWKTNRRFLSDCTTSLNAHLWNNSHYSGQRKIQGMERVLPVLGWFSFGGGGRVGFLVCFFVWFLFVLFCLLGFFKFFFFFILFSFYFGL